MVLSKELDTNMPVSTRCERAHAPWCCENSVQQHPPVDRTGSRRHAYLPTVQTALQVVDDDHSVRSAGQHAGQRGGGLRRSGSSTPACLAARNPSIASSCRKTCRDVDVDVEAGPELKLRHH
ncbi:hypothetical protein EYF80_042712 [Liparis tanakae]|uniref:Uncharacterized protein n=1 Tax=Liparis tanakae TaxID=230148 RepID=A0A4Z2G1R6_9TELE|nr:hypothetical protein EYF80_042712 [Liparis tanakae]